MAATNNPCFVYNAAPSVQRYKHYTYSQKLIIPPTSPVEVKRCDDHNPGYAVVPYNRDFATKQILVSGGLPCEATTWSTERIFRYIFSGSGLKISGVRNNKVARRVEFLTIGYGDYPEEVVYFSFKNITMLHLWIKCMAMFYGLKDRDMWFYDPGYSSFWDIVGIWNMFIVGILDAEVSIFRTEDPPFLPYHEDGIFIVPPSMPSADTLFRLMDYLAMPDILLKPSVLLDRNTSIQRLVYHLLEIRKYVLPRDNSRLLMIGSHGRCEVLNNVGIHSRVFSCVECELDQLPVR